MMAIERLTMSNPIEEEQQLANRAENFSDSDIAMDPTILDDMQVRTSGSEDADVIAGDDEEEDLARPGSVDPLSDDQE